MKYLIGIFFVSSLLFANEFENKDCYLIKNQLDRKYCLDKKLEQIKVSHKDEIKWYTKHGITKDNKENRIQKIDYQILAIQEDKTLLDQKLASLESLKKTINETKIQKKAKPYVEPKEKLPNPKKETKTPEKKETKAKKKKESPANGLQGQLKNVLENIGKKK